MPSQGLDPTPSNGRPTQWNPTRWEHTPQGDWTPPLRPQAVLPPGSLLCCCYCLSADAQPPLRLIPIQIWQARTRWESILKELIATEEYKGAAEQSGSTPAELYA